MAINKIGSGVSNPFSVLLDGYTISVKQGETAMAAIAQRTKVELHALMEANPQVSDPNALKPGQAIRIPQGTLPQEPAIDDERAEVSRQNAQSPAQIDDPMSKSLTKMKVSEQPTPEEAVHNVQEMVAQQGHANDASAHANGKETRHSDNPEMRSAETGATLEENKVSQQRLASTISQKAQELNAQQNLTPAEPMSSSHAIAETSTEGKPEKLGKLSEVKTAAEMPPDLKNQSTGMRGSEASSESKPHPEASSQATAPNQPTAGNELKGQQKTATLEAQIPPTDVETSHQAKLDQLGKLKDLKAGTREFDAQTAHLSEFRGRGEVGERSDVSTASRTEQQATQKSASREGAALSKAGAESSPQTQGGDPLLKSMLQMKLNQSTQTPGMALPSNHVMYADTTQGPGNANATKSSAPNVAPEVSALLAKGAKNPEAKAEFTTAQQAIASRDYSKAFNSLKTLMTKQGEEVLPEDEVKSTLTVRDQLEFLTMMQNAGIPADYPPTESQLTEYFSHLKNSPQAARDAFQQYAQNFHVHPANIQGADFDVKYSQEKIKKGQTEYTVDVPKDWSAVANRPVKDPQFIAKQMNDCQGFAFMAEKMLAAAGFKVEHHLAVYPGVHDQGHSMVMFTHAQDPGQHTVVSNDRVFQGTKAKEVAGQAYAYAAGQENVSKREHYYTGRNMAEAELQQVLKEQEL